MDLDGTLTQHKSKLAPICRDTLNELAKRYKLLMVCAGGCERVFRQIDGFPIEIIGYYGMQLSTSQNGSFELLENHIITVDKLIITERVNVLRQEFKLEEYWGNSVEFHASGMITFPILGTDAPLDKKLAYDPDRTKRRNCYRRVKEVFHDYNVFIGGSSSFDIVPSPYCKLYALEKYLEITRINRNNIVYFGDDYGVGGNDEDIFRSDIETICIDNYRNFPRIAKELLLK